MAIPLITEVTIHPATTMGVVKQTIRDSITAAGFPEIDYDQYEYYGTHWVVEYIWNPDKASCRIFIEFFLEEFNYNSFGLKMKLHQDWDTTSHSSQFNFYDWANVDLPYGYDPTNAYFPLGITVINHPEVKGFVWTQRENFGALYFVQPQVIYEGFGYDDINFPWAFLVYGGTGSVIESQPNPFGDEGSRLIESWAQLKYRNFKEDLPTHQIVPGPRILSPNETGFIGAFSSDVCLIASNKLGWKKVVTVGVKRYMLLRPQVSSGVALALN